MFLVNVIFLFVARRMLSHRLFHPYEFILLLFPFHRQINLKLHVVMAQPSSHSWSPEELEPMSTQVCRVPTSYSSLCTSPTSSETALVPRVPGHSARQASLCTASLLRCLAMTKGIVMEEPSVSLAES